MVQPLINDETGNLRKRRTYETAFNRRSQALDASGAMILENIQNSVEEALQYLYRTLFILMMSSMAWFFGIFDDAQGAAMVQQSTVLFTHLQFRIMALMGLDYDLADIQPEDELPRGHSLHPRRHPSILESFTCDDQALWATNFSIAELVFLRNFFNLNGPAYADGFLRIAKYCFTADEILLFVLIKYKSGSTNTKMCDDVMFGGDSRKWTPAIQWFFERIGPMIQPYISLDLLRHYRQNMGPFAQQIANRIREGFNVEDPDTGVIEWVPGIEYDNDNDPFRVFGFVDCSLFRTSTPGTGPRGRYPGAARNEDAYNIQRAVYTGWKVLHGVKMLSIVLPNGIQMMHGPISARHNDITSAHRAGLLQCLTHVQQENQIKYCLFGDGIFHALVTVENCIRSYHREGDNDAPLTELQRHENRIMKKIRVLIEHTYADVENHYPIINVKNQWKPSEENSQLPYRLQFAFFLANVHTCVHGNSMSKTFQLIPPRLEEFLGNHW